MSGSGNGPNPRDEQSQPRGGQPQGAQGGQPPGGQSQDGQPQSGQPRGRGSYGGLTQRYNSPVETLKRPKIQQYVKGSVVFNTLAAVAFALTMLLVGKVGGFPILPRAVQQTRNALQAFGGTTGPGGGAGASPSPVTQLDAGVSTTHEVIIAYMSTELAAFVAFGLAVVLATLITRRMTESRRTKLVTAGAGLCAGAFLFVFLVSVLIGMVGPAVPPALRGQLQAGTVSVSPALSSLQFANILVNSIVVGIGAGLAGLVTVFSLDTVFPA